LAEVDDHEKDRIWQRKERSYQHRKKRRERATTEPAKCLKRLSAIECEGREKRKDMTETMDEMEVTMKAKKVCRGCHTRRDEAEATRLTGCCHIEDRLVGRQITRVGKLPYLVLGMMMFCSKSEKESLKPILLLLFACLSIPSLPSPNDTGQRLARKCPVKQK
jgi:hypothetical protein